MKNNIRNILSIILLLLGLILVFWNLYSLDGSFTIVKFGQSRSQLQTPQNDLLLKGKMFVGAFTASTNNLGGVMFRFDNRNKMSKDSVIFRLIDADSKNEIYSGIYKVDQFQPKEQFPFGFPIISDSKNKSYIFEIESVNGNENDAIALSRISPIFSIKYQFSKIELKTPQTLFIFLFLKLYSLISDRQFVTYFLIYLSPFVVFNLFNINKQSKNKKYIHSFLPIIFILILIFSEGKRYALSSQILAFDWLITVLFFRMEGAISVLPTLLFLIISILSLLLKSERISEDTIIWMYFFLLFSIFQMTIEIFLKPKYCLNTEKYINSVNNELKRLMKVSFHK